MGEEDYFPLSFAIFHLSLKRVTGDIVLSMDNENWQMTTGK